MPPQKRKITIEDLHVKIKGKDGKIASAETSVGKIEDKLEFLCVEIEGDTSGFDKVYCPDVDSVWRHLEQYIELAGDYNPLRITITAAWLTQAEFDAMEVVD